MPTARKPRALPDVLVRIMRTSLFVRSVAVWGGRVRGVGAARAQHPADAMGDAREAAREDEEHHEQDHEHVMLSSQLGRTASDTFLLSVNDTSERPSSV